MNANAARNSRPWKVGSTWSKPNIVPGGNNNWTRAVIFVNPKEKAMSQDKNLAEEFVTLEKQVRTTVQIGGGTDSRLMLGVALLGQSIVRLDKTSSRLAWINIGVGCIVMLIGVLQVIVMLKGH